MDIFAAILTALDIADIRIFVVKYYWKQKALQISDDVRESFRVRLSFRINAEAFFWVCGLFCVSGFRDWKISRLLSPLLWRSAALKPVFERKMRRALSFLLALPLERRFLCNLFTALLHSSSTTHYIFPTHPTWLITTTKRWLRRKRNKAEECYRRWPRRWRS